MHHLCLLKSRTSKNHVLWKISKNQKNVSQISQASTTISMENHHSKNPSNAKHPRDSIVSNQSPNPLWENLEKNQSLPIYRKNAKHPRDSSFDQWLCSSSWWRPSSLAAAARSQSAGLRPRRTTGRWTPGCLAAKVFQRGKKQRWNDQWLAMKYHEMSWNVMKCHEMSWNVMKCHEMSWNVMKCHEISWNIMKYHEILVVMIG